MMIKKIIFQVLLFLFLYSHTVESLRFFLVPNVKKCLKEQIQKNVVVTGQYEFSDGPQQKASIHVTDTNGQILFKREDFVDTKGKFAFTTDTFDIFDICFITKLPQGLQSTEREVHLIMKHGVEAKNYEELGKAEKLKPLEVQLRYLEDLSESIVQDFAYMRAREEEMRNTNESTNSRLMYLNVFSMICLLCLTIWQVLYLRRYFKAKKLID